MLGERLVSRRRRRRRLSPILSLALALSVVGGIVFLWVTAFSPIFITPREFHDNAKAFNVALRRVLLVGPESANALPPWPPELNAEAGRLVYCAESQVIDKILYEPKRRILDYPWGDLPPHLGTSADMVVRCFRRLGIDLQQFIHVDRGAHPETYPKIFAQRTPDRHMDHRRVTYLYAFARSYLPAVPVEANDPAARAEFLPGDLVFWLKGGTQGYPGLVGIVLDRRDEQGRPLVATLVPEEKRMSGRHRIDTWPIKGHFRSDIDAMLQAFYEQNPQAVIVEKPAP